MAGPATQFAPIMESLRLADDATLLKRRARRRLVGAIALVVLVVVVLPVVLDQEPRPVTQALTVQIPSQDGGPFNTRVLPPLPPPPAAPQKSAEDDARKAARPEPKAAEPAPQARAPQKESAGTTGKERGKMDVAEARRTPAPLKEPYVVPLGAFTNPDNAKQVQDRAANAGIKSYTERLKTPQGEHTRVRAGPFTSRDAAEKARDKLKSLGLEVGQVAQR
jgi:DedD protein